MKKTDLDTTVGRGYVGRWDDGAIGWCLPDHLYNQIESAEPPSEIFDRNGGPKDRAVLCEITVRVLRDKFGRERTRKAKRPQK